MQAFRKLDGMGGTLPISGVAHLPITHDCDEVMFFYQWLGFPRQFKDNALCYI